MAGRGAPAPGGRVFLVTLVTGAGGMLAALPRNGYNVVAMAFSEIDVGCRRVIYHHFPDAIDLGDIRDYRRGNLKRIMQAKYFIGNEYTLKRLREVDGHHSLVDQGRGANKILSKLKSRNIRVPEFVKNSLEALGKEATNAAAEPHLLSRI